MTDNGEGARNGGVGGHWWLVALSLLANVAEVDADLVVQQEMENSQSFTNQLRAVLTKGISNPSQAVLVQEDLNRHLQDPKVRARLKSMDVTPTDAQGVFDLCKQGHDNHVKVDQFIIGLLRLHGMAKAVDMLSLVYENRVSSMEARKEAHAVLLAYIDVVRTLAYSVQRAQAASSLVQGPLLR